jgi:hypothetical protein
LGAGTKEVALMTRHELTKQTHTNPTEWSLSGNHQLKGSQNIQTAQEIVSFQVLREAGTDY